jgi:co-chaperonin GroES (HSP10)
MRLEVFGKRLYVILNPVHEKQVGSIIVPDKHSELTRIATVQCVGDKVEKFKVGDQILLSYHSGVVIAPVEDGFSPSNEIFRIITEDEILAKIVD